MLPPIALSGAGRPLGKQPNILFILADDYGWRDTGVTGSEYYETPNIDRVALDGVNFTRSYAACQVSSPSRASLMTGLFTTRHGITDWIGEKSGEDWRSMGRHDRLLPADYVHELDYEHFRCLPQLLHDGGYITFMAGKWHLGESSTPEKAGFDINVGGYWAGSPFAGYFVPYDNPKLPDGPAGENLSMRLAKETNAFLERQASDPDAKPFFAYLSFYAVHAPIQTTRENWQYFRDKAVWQGAKEENTFEVDGNLPVNCRQDNPVYAGLVRQMDDAVGAVLDKLSELGLDDDTIVIFTSDNGGVSSGDNYSTSNLPLRGGKGRQWEGGLRVPLFVSIPGNGLKGTENDCPVCTVDMFATILDYAGVHCPKDVDGVSIRPLMSGRRIAPRPLFWHYPHYGNQGGAPSSVIIEGDWKLIFYHEDGHNELYNLAEDQVETDDVSARYPARVRKMSRKLQSWLKQTAALMPVQDTLYDPSAHDAYRQRECERVIRRESELHNRRLRPDFCPNADWWGSETVD